MYNSWRRFQFFDKELVTADGSSNGVPHPELQKLKVTAAASGKGQLVFGDSDGCITVSTGQAQRKHTKQLLARAHACVGKQMGRVGSCRTSHRHLYAGN